MTDAAKSATGDAALSATVGGLTRFVMMPAIDCSASAYRPSVPQGPRGPERQTL
jgi:hypothetical protein